MDNPIEGNLNSNRYVHEVLHSEVISLRHPGAIFQQDITPTCCKDCSRPLFSPTHATSSLACLFEGYVTY
ncbi:hypothetical protein TNCV_2631301 [Trichonephila clavipes]|nr:hypothetical protein TNCV_2631301 [Trichonephila clavipes]